MHIALDGLSLYLFDSSRLSIERLLPPPPEKCNRLLYCASKIYHKMAKQSKTCAIRRQNCSDLSKSEGRLCCCHETGLKPVLLMLKRENKIFDK